MINEWAHVAGQVHYTVEFHDYAPLPPPLLCMLALAKMGRGLIDLKNFLHGQSKCLIKMKFDWTFTPTARTPIILHPTIISISML